jgi:hypothetical protein
MKALWFGPRWCRFAGRAGLLLLLLPAVGCGGSRGQVSGQVLYHGKPVRGGWVTFRPADSRQNLVNAQLDANGRYEALLPTGEVQIAIDNRELEPAPPERGAARAVLPPGVKFPPAAKSAAESSPPAAAPPPEVAPQRLAGTYVPIPASYYTVETSGLTYSVKPGPQSYDIELK